HEPQGKVSTEVLRGLTRRATRADDVGRHGDVRQAVSAGRAVAPARGPGARLATGGKDEVTDIRVVMAEGRDPAARGRQIGRGLGDLIEGSIGFYTGYVERRGVRAEDLREFLAPHLAAAQANRPLEVALLRGMAERGMVPFRVLSAGNAFEG